MPTLPVALINYNVSYQIRVDQKRYCDKRFYDENSCTQIVDNPLDLFMGKINQYITLSVAPKFIYGVLIPDRNIASSFQLTTPFFSQPVQLGRDVPAERLYD